MRGDDANGGSMLSYVDIQKRVRPAADKAYDAAGFVMELRDTPHAAQNQSGRRSAIDGRTNRRPGYAISQRASANWRTFFGAFD